MELKELTIEEMETRKAEILSEIDGIEDMETLEERKAELEAIKTEMESRQAEETEKAEIRQQIVEGAGTVIRTFTEEKKEMKTPEEIRSSKEYIDAFARYLITEDSSECRALLTTNASGSVAVPTIVDEIIHTAWDNEEILSRVTKRNVRGNYKASFELSADGAYVHTEGTSAPTEEALALGIVELIPRNIKKWIHISDEAIAMGGETLVRYIYDEVTYQIIKALAAQVVADVAQAPTSATSSAASVAKITEAASVTTFAHAFANLSDEARNPVIVMNKLTYANFVDAQAGGNFSFDPFRGMTVLFNNSLPAYDSAATNAVYAFVGDMSGVTVNYPEGDGIVIKYDDLTEAEADLVKIVGRQYVAHGLTACGRFCVIAKPSSTT